MDQHAYGCEPQGMKTCVGEDFHSARGTYPALKTLMMVGAELPSTPSLLLTIGMTWLYPPPAAPPLMPKVGPWLGWRMQVTTWIGREVWEVREVWEGYGPLARLADAGHDLVGRGGG